MTFLNEILEAANKAQKNASPVSLHLGGNDITIEYTNASETWGKFIYGGLVNQTFKKDGSPIFTNVHHIGVTLQIVTGHSTCDGKPTTLHDNYEIVLEGGLTKNFKNFLNFLSYELEMARSI